MTIQEHQQVITSQLALVPRI